MTAQPTGPADLRPPNRLNGRDPLIPDQPLVTNRAVDLPAIAHQTARTEPVPLAPIDGPPYEVPEVPADEQVDLAERIRAGLARMDDELAAALLEPNIGDLTAFDLPYGPPPDQLIDPYMTPEGVTVIYGKGGTGKGLATCYIVVQLIRAGHVVMILDFEFHRREWGSRLRGLGLTDAELRRVHWRSPSSDDWTDAKGTIGQVYKLVRADCDAVGVTALAVDSYTVATSGDDALGGQAAAQEFFMAISRIGRPAWVIAHVAGASVRFPDRPFGSVFVHNFARETWAVEPLDTPEVEPDPFQPAVVALELRNKKANGRSKAAAQFMTFSFMADGSIEADVSGPAERPLVELIADVLAAEPLTIKAIVAAIKEDTGRETNEDGVRPALHRYPRRFIESATGRPKKWSIRP